jgi:hypothetical protein
MQGSGSALRKDQKRMVIPLSGAGQEGLIRELEDLLPRTRRSIAMAQSN